MHRTPPLKSGRVSSRATRFFLAGNTLLGLLSTLLPCGFTQGQHRQHSLSEDTGSERRDMLRSDAERESGQWGHPCVSGSRAQAGPSTSSAHTSVPSRPWMYRVRFPRTQDTSYRQKEPWEPRVRPPPTVAAVSLPGSPASGVCSLPETLEATLRPSVPMALCLALARAVPSACHTLPRPPELPVSMSPAGSLPQPQLLELLKTFVESRS